MRVLILTCLMFITSMAQTDCIPVSSGSQHICGLHTSGEITCWGKDYFEQVSNTPSHADFVSVSSGFGHNCGLHSNGGITCWGRDHDGQVSNTPLRTGLCFSFEWIST